MEIVELPLGRHSGNRERVALRRGLSHPGGAVPFLRLIDSSPVTGMFCSACAAPIEAGAVWRGEEAFCSVECSLGGNRPA